MRTVQIISGRHPFEVTLLATSLACGIALLITDIRPPSVVIAMPVVVQATWQVGLVVVGVAGLLGVTWPGHVLTGLGIELGALVLLGTTTAMYSIAIIAISGRSALVAGSFIGAVTVASLWRSAQLMLDLRRLIEASQQDDIPVVPPLPEEGEKP
ncbi:hypothetical protein GCM10027290_07460 [Micromonospora sonneratiae]|jgi:hypothetical protein|uniref:Uncharacterized protein n=1 Tax=Micromonospora sonneratiae TaxID=1184706 RepID=A0ABW3YD66_9ACTN